jgi:hypothetical protein
MISDLLKTLPLRVYLVVTSNTKYLLRNVSGFILELLRIYLGSTALIQILLILVQSKAFIDTLKKGLEAALDTVFSTAPWCLGTQSIWESSIYLCGLSNKQIEHIFIVIGQRGISKCAFVIGQRGISKSAFDLKICLAVYGVHEFLDRPLARAATLK